jgi:Ca2+-binding EF-hand superfamily protein
MFCVVIDIVDPNRDGYVSLQEYMAFMISKETENVQSSEEIENAFRAITAGDRPYVTKEELYAVSKLLRSIIYLPKLKHNSSRTAAIVHQHHCHFMKTYN